MGSNAQFQHADRVLSVVGGQLARVKSPEDAIRESWQRCLRIYDLDPALPHATAVTDTADLKGRQDRLGPLLETAKLEMCNLYDQTAGSGYAILLTDPDGIVLNYVAEPGLERTFQRAGLQLGADWSEEHEGTNGIGTCMVENQPIIVHLDDHFRHCHTRVTSSATPILNAAGELLAVLDASSINSADTKQGQLHTMALVKMSAKIVENYDFLNAYQHATVLRFHSRREFVGLLSEGMIAIGEDGRILAVNPSAVSQLGYSGRDELLGRPVDEMLDVTPSLLAGRATRHSHGVWPVRELRNGRRYFAMVKAPAKKVGGTPLTRRGDPPVSPLKPRSAALSLRSLAGDDPVMVHNVRCAQRIMNKDVPVLLYGETGTGKEAFALAVHDASERRDKPLVAVNCAAVPETLIESELFGYRPGAFTGARREGMRGKILQSDGGTLFLDEIGDMRTSLQTRLLRVLEEKEVLPLASEVPVPVDLHVITATHRHLPNLVATGEFREDLFYRLNGIALTLPPLRERSDRAKLIQSMLKHECEGGDAVVIEDDVIRRLQEYPWPGNIRQLRNVLRTALALCDGGILRLRNLPAELTETRDGVDLTDVQAAPERGLLQSAERRALISALKQNRWNVTNTADQLKISRNTLYRKMKKYDISLSASA